MGKKHFSIVAASIVTSLTIIGCGGGSSASTSSGTLQLNPLLANIDYTCGANSGKTDSNGKYYFDAGDSCTFTIGGLRLSANPESNLTIDEILENTSNSGVSKGAIWAYMSAATGLTQAEMSSAGSITIPESFKNATDDIIDFSSFDALSEALLSDTDIDTDTLSKFEENMAKIPSAKTQKRVSLNFEEIDTPITDTTMNTQQASSKVYVNNEEQDISYTTIMRTGYEDNGEILGQSKDYQDKAITFEDGSAYVCRGTTVGGNRNPGSGMDFTSLHNVDGKLYVISQYECGIGSFYKVELEQDETTGALSTKEGTLEYISQKDEFGGWVHCAGMVTPWNSHLGSEEYEEDANSEAGYYLADVGEKYWGDASKASAYYYGWTPEIKINNEGNAEYAKHYAMGRFSHEIAYVMPDNKTVYLSDDGTNVGFFMYVADTAKDLSSGTLYAAKWNQTSSTGAGSADITWVNLGHATNSEIREYLDPDGDVTTNDALTFSDIFDSVEGSDGTCTEGYTSVNTSWGHECLTIKEGMEKAASRLETRRYAAILGATTEFRKEEGISFDKNTGTLYVAMSEVGKGMTDNSSNDLGGNNDIKLEANKCGAVYALDVNTDIAKDTVAGTISSEYVVKNMYSIVAGTPMSYSEDSVYYGNTCNVNGISNPDNVAFLDNSDILMIGEDTGAHENNMVWSYNVKTKELTRTFTTPLKAETTSPFWYADLANGFGYLGVVTQHPGSNTSDGGESAFGYVGPFKNLTSLQESQSISSVTKLATLDTKIEGGTEIVAFDESSNKMFTTNGANNTLDITPISYNDSTMSLGTTVSIDLSTYGSGVQSVAAKNGKVAVAVGASNKVTTKGKVVVFDTNGTLISQTSVGYLPDMLTFNEDGTKIIVANEGEPIAKDEGYLVINEETSTNVLGLGDYVDVPGTVGIVTLASADENNNANGYAEIGFSSDDLLSATDGTAVRLGGTPSNNVALDMEPEYITVNGNYAYVTLQENNAIAKIDISGVTPSVMGVQSLGAKDYESENTIDILLDGQAYMTNYTALKGLYMPDSIASYTASDDKTYLVTANEGDGREYCLDTDPDCDNPVYADEKRISSGSLQSSLSSSLETYYKDLEDDNPNADKFVKALLDMTNVDNESVYIMGARSFSIWDDEGSLVFDSGDEISKLTSKFMPTLFNQDDGDIDGRSDDKGVEPEALSIGKIGNKTYAFIGLERQNAIVIYDITKPANAKFVKYIITEDDGDISPEGMNFVEAENSPTGNPLLLVAFEISGTTAVYEIK